MKYTKILGILVLILVAVTFLGIVSAAEETIGDQKFNIPDGFEENTDAAKEKLTQNGKTYVRNYKNAEGASVTINVIVANDDVTKVTVPPQPGDENRTINGVEGYYNPDTHKFTYVNGTTQIIISGSRDGVIEDFIMA